LGARIRIEVKPTVFYPHRRDITWQMTVAKQ
jgi:hypothetical protein